MSYFEIDWAGVLRFYLNHECSIFLREDLSRSFSRLGLSLYRLYPFDPFIFVCSHSFYLSSDSLQRWKRFGFDAMQVLWHVLELARPMCRPYCLRSLRPRMGGGVAGFVKVEDFPFTEMAWLALALGCTEECWFCEVKCRKHQRVQGCWRLLNSTHVRFMSPFVG